MVNCIAQRTRKDNNRNNSIHNHEECARDKPVDRTATCLYGKVPKLDAVTADDGETRPLYGNIIRGLCYE